MTWSVVAQPIKPELAHDFLVTMAQVIPTLLIAHMLTGSDYIALDSSRKVERGEVSSFYWVLVVTLGGMFVVLLGVLEVLPGPLSTALAGAVVLFQVTLILIQPLDSALSKAGAGRWKVMLAGGATIVAGLALTVTFVIIILSRG